MDAKLTDDKGEQPPRMSYIPPSRVGLKALTVHVPPVWVVNMKIYGAKKGRALQGLVVEALQDLAKKLEFDLDWTDEDDASKAQDNERPPKGLTPP